MNSAKACSVHIDVLPAMTGVSRFGEEARPSTRHLLHLRVLTCASRAFTARFGV